MCREMREGGSLVVDIKGNSATAKSRRKLRGQRVPVHLPMINATAAA